MENYLSDSSQHASLAENAPDRASLLLKLVIEGHVNVAERRIIGAAGRQELAEIVKMLLLRQGCFPAHKASSAVYEGATLVQASPGVQIIWERAYPLNPDKLAERRVVTFPDLDRAIDAFIDSEWKAGIDGIAVEPHH